jgi:hypothetical protein
MSKKKPKDKNRKSRKRKKRKSDETSELNKVKEYVRAYVENQTSKPVLVSIDENPDVAIKLGNLLVAFTACIGAIGNCQYDFSLRNSSSISQNDISRLEILTKKECFSEDDKVFLGHLIPKSCSKACLVPYISKQMNWIVVSILSAHYLSSIILMRSILELTIALLANEKGGLSKKINSISVFDDNQKSDIKKTWDSLCSWSHPYNKWLKNMCPIYMAHPPLYHPEHFKTSIEFLEKVIDIFLVVCKEHFKMNIKELRKRVETLSIDLSDFRLFISRFESTKLDKTKDSHSI